MISFDWNKMKADDFAKIVAEIDAEVMSGAHLSVDEEMQREELVKQEKHPRDTMKLLTDRPRKVAAMLFQKESTTSDDVLQMIRDEARISSNEGLGHFDEEDFTEPQDGEMFLTLGEQKWRIRCEAVS